MKGYIKISLEEYDQIKQDKKRLEALRTNLYHVKGGSIEFNIDCVNEATKEVLNTIEEKKKNVYELSRELYHSNKKLMEIKRNIKYSSIWELIKLRKSI